MWFGNLLLKQFLTRPGRVASVGLAVTVAGLLISEFWVTGTGHVIAVCGFFTLLAAALILLLRLIGQALPDETGTAARVMIGVATLLFIAFFQLLVAAIATSGNPSVLAAVIKNQSGSGVGSALTSAVAFGSLLAIPLLVVFIPETLRRNRCWRAASELAKTLVPAWLAASAAAATWLYVVAQHFFGGPLAGVTVEVVLVGGLAAATLLAPVYQFAARSCWEHGVEVVLDPHRWRETWRKVVHEELGTAFKEGDTRPGA